MHENRDAYTASASCSTVTGRQAAANRKHASRDFAFRVLRFAIRATRNANSKTRLRLRLCLDTAHLQPRISGSVGVRSRVAPRMRRIGASAALTLLVLMLDCCRMRRPEDRPLGFGWILVLLCLEVVTLKAVAADELDGRRLGLRWLPCVLLGAHFALTTIVCSVLDVWQPQWYRRLRIRNGLLGGAEPTVSIVDGPETLSDPESYCRPPPTPTAGTRSDSTASNSRPDLPLAPLPDRVAAALRERRRDRDSSGRRSRLRCDKASAMVPVLGVNYIVSVIVVCAVWHARFRGATSLRAFDATPCADESIPADAASTTDRGAEAHRLAGSVGDPGNLPLRVRYEMDGSFDVVDAPWFQWLLSELSFGADGAVVRLEVDPHVSASGFPCAQPNYEIRPPWISRFFAPYRTNATNATNVTHPNNGDSQPGSQLSTRGASGGDGAASSGATTARLSADADAFDGTCSSADEISPSLSRFYNESMRSGSPADRLGRADQRLSPPRRLKAKDRGLLSGWDALLLAAPLLSAHIRLLLAVAATVVWRLWLVYAVSQVYFYCAHRFVHSSPFLFRHVHGMHHTIADPFALSTLYCSISETVFLNLGAVLAGPVLLGPDLFTNCLWMALAGTYTPLAHAGHGSAAVYHHRHHMHMSVNFGSPVLDALFGTDYKPSAPPAPIRFLPESPRYRPIPPPDRTRSFSSET